MDKYHVINLSEYRYETITARAMILNKDDDLQIAKIQHHEMINKIQIIVDALDPYCHQEHIQYSSSLFVERCEEKGLAVAREKLEEEHPFVEIQPDIHLGKNMMKDLFKPFTALPSPDTSTNSSI